MFLEKGVRLGPYEILEPIGFGGMGEVYKGRDGRLDRLVAIKILPRELASKAHLRARFELEAKSISAMSDPHICALHDLGSDGGTDYLVMELCEGMNLGQLLGRGPLPLSQALEYGAQIAGALEHAHRRGIIHRDLKPSNVAITRGGVKVLDFGLATPRTAASADVSERATAARALPEEEPICGTVQYMAPEVLKGDPADARSDVFSLGLVLYEMITGKPAFAGSNRASLIAAILEREPVRPTEINPGTPPLLERLIDSCLAKDPEQRVESAHDVKLQLEWLAHHGCEPVRVAKPPPRRAFIGILGLAVFALAAGIAGFLLASRMRQSDLDVASRNRPAAWTVADLRDAASLALGQTFPRIGFFSPVLALSHDGTMLVYVGVQDGKTSLFSRRLDSWQIHKIPGTEGANFACFSPDDSWIGFLTDEKVMKIPTKGGSAIALADAYSPVRAVWLADENLYVGDAQGSSLKIIRPSGESVDVTFGLGIQAKLDDVLPAGNAVLISIRDKLSGDFSRVALFDLRSRTMRTIVTGGYDARFVPPRTLLFARGSDLHAVVFDPGSGEVIGVPSIIQSGIATDSFFRQAQYAASSSGVLAYVPGSDRAVGRMAWVERSGTTTFLDLPPRAYGTFDIAPDGRRVAIQVSDVSDFLMLTELGRGDARRVPVSGDVLAPQWTPDGRGIVAAVRSGEGETALVRFQPDLAESPETIHRARGWITPQSVAPDGHRVAFNDSSNVGIVTLGNPSEVAWIRQGDDSWGGEFSPDGRWIALASARTDSPEIWLHDVESPDRAYQLSIGGGVEPVWSRETGELFYRNGRRWYAVRVSTAPVPAWDAPRLVWETDFIDTPGVSYDVSPDGERLLVSKPVADEIRDRIHIVQNWLALVPR